MALVPGVQYGLSSHDNFDEHKSLIFAKLTDSSYRAIQEYLKNRVSSSCHISIHAFRVREARIIMDARTRLSMYMCAQAHDTHLSTHMCISACIRARGYVRVYRNIIPRRENERNGEVSDRFAHLLVIFCAKFCRDEILSFRR